MTRRDFLKIAAASGTGVVLAACAPSTPAPEPTEEPAVEPTEKPAVEPTSPPAPAEKVTLQIVTQFGGAMKDIFQESLDQFNASQDAIEAKGTYVSHPELWPKVMASVAAGEPPATFTYCCTTPVSLALEGHLAEVTDYMEWPDDIFPSCESPVNGKHYAVPLQNATKLNFYNADWFREAGLDPDNPPATWDDWVEQGPKLLDPDEGKFAVALMLQPMALTTDVWMSFLFSAGGELLNEDNTAAAFNTDAGLEAINYWVDLFQKYKLAPAEPLDGMGVWLAWSGGTAAMMPQSSVCCGGLPDLDFEGHAAEMPMYKQKGSTSTPDYFPFFKDSHPAEMAEFCKFWLQPEHLATFATKAGTLPVRKSGADHEIYQDFLATNRDAQVSAATLDYARGFPAVAGWDELASKAAEQLEAAAYGRVDPEEALEKAEAAVNEVLQGG
jgi:ABC-type glycerol-3-phosphate transport system substrate-binding protein